MTACDQIPALEPSVAVIVASLGRPDLVHQFQDLMARQTSSPDMLLFSVVSAADLPSGLEESTRLRVVRGSKGLCAQRNRALDWLNARFDIVVFYDDDFVPSKFSIEHIRAFFAEHPHVAGATGTVLADGINGAGISYDEALQIVRGHEERGFAPNCIVRELRGLYGCNMAYRTAAIGEHRFDERLRLYAWQEDIDFAASVGRNGRIVQTFAFAGVHRGVKLGRTPGMKLGYSQIVNPSYLVRKGTMSHRFAARLMLRNLAANHLKAFRPEPWVDRAGRVKGNWIGLFDLIRGRLTPERIETL
ncbi:glycosyltransferase family 2 protein [Novosphingobium mathurense]|uniref:Glycosyltransferase, GT2 family n=1 Tax=Novosphingobium mathurense TaxID=428990 RepID=A0A1U6HJB3_9SPHN|nr:glycosyltransferase [Novosphingobium mathurense]SLJ95884.1 Glycosyltransferase, GT2 family [Novosphingobium mathurense]